MKKDAQAKMFEYIRMNAKHLKNFNRHWVLANVDEYDMDDNWWAAHIIPSWMYIK